jgi:hypothetical protein
VVESVIIDGMPTAEGEISAGPTDIGIGTEACPVCKHPKSFFEIKPENY